MQYARITRYKKKTKNSSPWMNYADFVEAAESGDHPKFDAKKFKAYVNAWDANRAVMADFPKAMDFFTVSDDTAFWTVLVFDSLETLHAAIDPLNDIPENKELLATRAELAKLFGVVIKVFEAVELDETEHQYFTPAVLQECVSKA